MTSTLSIAASVLVENVFTGVCDLHEYLRHCSPGARLGKGAMLGFDRGVVGVATCCIRNVVPLRRLVGDCVQPRSEEPMTPERRSTRLVSNGKAVSDHRDLWAQVHTLYSHFIHPSPPETPVIITAWGLIQ